MSGAKRWLEETADPGARALRQALDDASPGPGDEAFARQRVWPRVQAPWWDRSGRLASPRWGGGWLTPLLVGAGVALAATVTVLGSANLLRDRSLATAPAAQPAAAGPRLAPEVIPLPAPPAALSTGPGERVRHRLARGVDAELLPRTALVPGEDGSPPEVKVGRVRFSVPHQPPGQRFSVRAGAFRVVVLGTVFDVAVEEAGVSVAVASGTVEVHEVASDRLVQRLPAGASWSSEPAAGPPAVRPPPPRRAVRPTSRPALRKLAQARPAHPAAARALARVSLDRPADPVRAIARYQKMVEAGGPAAELALFSIAEIEHRELGDLGRAARSWQRYSERYPEGLLRAEADLWRIEALTGLDDAGLALQAARAFLQRHTDSERRVEIARVAGDLSRHAGDCPAALGFYDLALQGPPISADADDALFYRADCLDRQGDSQAAAMKAYLGRFPLGRHAVEAQQRLRAPASPRRP